MQVIKNIYKNYIYHIMTFNKEHEISVISAEICLKISKNTQLKFAVMEIKLLTVVHIDTAEYFVKSF